MAIRDLYTPYSYQEDAIAQALASKKPCIAIIGPPGSGKSMVNLLLAEHYPKAVILCVTKQLQRQYENYHIPDVRSVSGKNNYPCPAGYAVDCETANDMDKCRGCQYKAELSCPYWLAEAEADDAPIAITNYSYYFMQTYFGNALHNRHSVIFDEAHEFDRTMLGLMDVEWNRNYDEPKLGFKLPATFSKHQWKEASKLAIAKLGKDKESKKLLTKFALTNIAFSQEDAWIFEMEGRIIRIRPKWVSPDWTKELIKKAPKVILSSATFYPPYVGSLLGFREDEIEVIEMPSTFPPEYRPFIFKKVARVSTHKGTPEESIELDKLVLEIDRIMAEHHKEKGLLHTVSYKLRDEILKRTRFPERFMTHDSTSRQTVIDAFRKAPAGVMLASPSMTTGVDFPYDQLNYQIIAKLPVPSLGDKRVVIRKEERKEIHDAEVRNTLIQMYGRAMRGKDDFGITYVLDTWAHYFYQNNITKFPRYVREAVIVL